MGLYIRRIRSLEAVAAIATGVSVVAVIELTRWSSEKLFLSPALLGLGAALAAMLTVMAWRGYSATSSTTPIDE